MFGLFRKKAAEDGIPPGKLKGEIWVVEGHRLGEKWSLEEGELKLGRGLDDPRAINFPDNAKFVSGEHAVFRKEDDAGYTLEDLDSKNGTFVNGRRISKKVRLHDGDEVEIGQCKFRVSLRPVEEARVDSLRGEVEIVQGTYQGQKWSLDEGDLVVGRELDGQGVISFPETETQLSSEHAAFKKHKGAYWIHDLSSKNGTFVNGKLRTVHQLRDGDEVNLGEVVFRVQIRKA